MSIIELKKVSEKDKNKKPKSSEEKKFKLNLENISKNFIDFAQGSDENNIENNSNNEVSNDEWGDDVPPPSSKPKP